MPRKIVLSQLKRVVDVNYNRSKEGLRVCEDLCRFILNDRALTARLKKVRHELTAVVNVFGLKEIVAQRDIVGDVGKVTIGAESNRKDLPDIFYANISRVKESLRVLEEFSKLMDVKLAVSLKALRYSVYDIEKSALKKM